MLVLTTCTTSTEALQIQRLMLFSSNGIGRKGAAQAGKSEHTTWQERQAKQQQAMHDMIQEATEENQGHLKNMLRLGGPVDQLHLWKEISMIHIILCTPKLSN